MMAFDTEWEQEEIRKEIQAMQIPQNKASLQQATVVILLDELLKFEKGTITEEQLRQNLLRRLKKGDE